jgi:tRNA 2-selenouridine synthase SelU
MFGSTSNKKWIWVEAESRRIGNVNLPEAFYAQIKNSPFVFLNVPIVLNNF